MTAAEASVSTLGTRYAPDDPTLPEPWKGLIDGSTGLLYYWNPETNVTQYEKPTSLPPPLPPGPPPTATTSKLNPLPAARATQPDCIQRPHSQQLIQGQLPQPQGMLMSSSLAQQVQIAPQATLLQVSPQGQGSQLGATTQQGPLAPEQTKHQILQQAGQSGQSLLGQVPMQPRQQGLLQPIQSGHQAPYQLMQSMSHVQHGQLHPGAQMGTSHGFQFTPQQTQYMTHQQSMPLQGPQTSQLPQQLAQAQQMPHEHDHQVEPGPRDDAVYFQGKRVSPSHPQLIQGQQFPQPRESKPGISQREDVEFQQGNPSGFSPAQVQQTVQVQQMGTEVMHPQHGSRFQSQMGHGLIHGQRQNLSLVGSNVPFDVNRFGRAGNEHFQNTAKDANAMPHQLPKLAPLPVIENQTEVRIGNFPSQNVMSNPPGGLNGPGGPPLHGGYGHSSVAPPYPSNTFVRPPLAMMRPDSIHLSAADIYRQKHEVTATGDDVPVPFMTFDATGFPPEILHEIHCAGFTAPTPIQAQTWPIVLQNKDVVAIAKTGSGKTLGYLIPAFVHIRRLHNNPRNGPTMLVLAPTRELATQIQDEAIKFGRSSRVSCTCLYGGAPKGPQLKELDRGADIVVATPGRLNDILEMKRIDLRQVSLLVLDEADRMLDMGFEPQIRKIVNEIPPRRQTLMYTATWPKEVRKIASDLLSNPVQVNIGSVDELAANKSITQYVELVPELEKQRRLEQILRSQEHGSKVIVFCSTKKLCDQLARSLGRNFGAAAIHGDKSQGERDWVLNQFRMGKAPVLVATDVAARGLDIRDIRVVINYDFPTGIEDYVHRIGRTGRAGATGISYTFFSEQDWKYAPDLVKVLEGANQVVPPEIRDIAVRGGPIFGKDRGAINRYGTADVGGRWDSGSRVGTRDGGFGDRGGMRDGNYGGHGVRDGSFGGRGGMRDGGFGGRGGTKDAYFGGRGSGRGPGFGGASAGRSGWDRGGRCPPDRFDRVDARGRGRGRGRGQGRFDNRRDSSERRRGLCFSSSPERVRTWGYSRSRSRSRGRSRSYSRSRSRGRSYSRSHSSRSWSRSHSPRSSRSRSRSHSYERYERRPPRKTKFDQMEAPAPNTGLPCGNEPSVQEVPAAGINDGADLSNPPLPQEP